MLIVGHAMDSFVSITARFGETTDSPTASLIRSVIGEVFNESDPNISRNDYLEHPDAWIELGREDGSRARMTISRTGSIHLHQWADDDCKIIQVPPSEFSKVPSDLAIEMALAFARDDVAFVMGRLASFS